MSVLSNFRSFIIRMILGVCFLAISIMIFGSLFTYSLEDPGFGIVNNFDIINNWFGIFGAYLSSTLIVFLEYTSYIFAFFFFIEGFRFLSNKSDKFILIRFLGLIAGVFILNIFLVMINFSEGLIGIFIEKYLNEVFSNILNNYYLYFIFVFLLFFISLILVLLSLKIKLNIFNFIIRTAYKLILIIFKPLEFLNLSKIFLFFKPKKSSLQKKMGSRIRSEPTISKNKTRMNIYREESKIDKASIYEDDYILPSIDLLKTSNDKFNSSKESEKRYVEIGKNLELILKEYGVEGKITNFMPGPVVTLFEFIPAAGIKTSKVVGLSEDITRAMSTHSTRIALQPGKKSIGIEIPNKERESVYLGDLIKDIDFNNNSSSLTLALGKNISGEKKYTDLEKMPHLLIAGTTGSGKSVGINSMIISLLFQFKPNECKLILIDPKMLELSIYEDIPHLLTPVVTNPNKAVFALKWVVREMENRYRLMSSLNVKNITSYNAKITSALNSGRKLYREVQTGIDKESRNPIVEKIEIPLEKFPLIVVVIDEMADLMMVAGKEVENLVQRLAQMARASGIHLIAATQRPSVDVITGTIKANFPSRISFRVASRFDSRTILNEMGAEQLLGSGDMLFLENGANLNRLHGGFVSEKEIESVVNHIKSQTFNSTIKDITIEETHNEKDKMEFNFKEKNVDELYQQAIELVIDQQKVSTSFIQRYLQIGYNRAARIVEKMEEDGYISEPTNAGKRSVLKKNI